MHKAEVWLWIMNGGVIISACLVPIVAVSPIPWVVMILATVFSIFMHGHYMRKL